MKIITQTRFQAYSKDPFKFISELTVPGADPKKKFKEVWAPFQAEAFERLSPCLLAVAKGTMPSKRGMWFERTKGASKDSDVGCCILWVLLFARHPLLIEIGAEQQEQAAETLLAMKDVVRLNPWMKPQVEFLKSVVNGNQTKARMEVLTTTETGAHGSRPDMTVCNELSHITKRQFAETMADNADKVGHNFMVIATNAGALHTWQYDWRESYRRMAQRTRSDWWFQKFEDIAPWIPERNIENARRRNSTLRFNRLWKGIWSPQEGDAIDPEDIDAAIRLPGPMTPEEVSLGGYSVILGADAGIKHDHAALIALAVKRGDPRIRLARCESWAPPPGGKIDLTQMDAAIQRAHRDFPLLGMCYDPTQMELMAQRAEKVGVAIDPIWFTRGRESDEMVKMLLEHFRNRMIWIYRDELLIRDLHRLVIKETRLGSYKLDAVKDEYGHADRAIALAVVLPAAALVAQQSPVTEDAEAEHLVEAV